jgi:hypothetical protein
MLATTEGTTMRHGKGIAMLFIAVGGGIAAGLVWMLADAESSVLIALETRHVGGGCVRV